MPTKKLTKTKIKANTAKLKKIRKEFFAKIDKLRKKQDKLLADYMEMLEKKQMEKIKEDL